MIYESVSTVINTKHQQQQSPVLLKLSSVTSDVRPEAKRTFKTVNWKEKKQVFFAWRAKLTELSPASMKKSQPKIPKCSWGTIYLHLEYRKIPPYSKISVRMKSYDIVTRIRTPLLQDTKCTNNHESTSSLQSSKTTKKNDRFSSSLKTSCIFHYIGDGRRTCELYKNPYCL